mmetsp:Transcript_3082/g.7887  ORF Transcript_3082/g.7887 Transcript_3082/m.7887 type:complete len:313 (-) Transcript_3082:100-1038(-)
MRSRLPSERHELSLQRSVVASPATGTHSIAVDAGLHKLPLTKACQDEIDPAIIGTEGPTTIVVVNIHEGHGGGYAIVGDLPGEIPVRGTVVRPAKLVGVAHEQCRRRPVLLALGVNRARDDLRLLHPVAMLPMRVEVEEIGPRFPVLVLRHGHPIAAHEIRPRPPRCLHRICVEKLASASILEVDVRRHATRTCLVARATACFDLLRAEHRRAPLRNLGRDILSPPWQLCAGAPARVPPHQVIRHQADGVFIRRGPGQGGLKRRVDCHSVARALPATPGPRATAAGAHVFVSPTALNLGRDATGPGRPSWRG